MDGRTWCPDCDLPMRMTRRPFSLRGVDMGELPTYVCSSCGMACHSITTSKKIDRILKAKGLWGPRPERREGVRGSRKSVPRAP